jgi:hypothetical protein
MIGTGRYRRLCCLTQRHIRDTFCAKHPRRSRENKRRCKRWRATRRKLWIRTRFVCACARVLSVGVGNGPGSVVPVAVALALKPLRRGRTVLGATGQGPTGASGAVSDGINSNTLAIMLNSIGSAHDRDSSVSPRRKNGCSAVASSPARASRRWLHATGSIHVSPPMSRRPCVGRFPAAPGSTARGCFRNSLKLNQVGDRRRSGPIMTFGKRT